MEKKRKQEELILEAKSFLNSHKKEIIEPARKGENVVHIPFPKLSEFSPELADNIIDKPEETIALIEDALEELGYVENPRVRLLELPQSAYVKIRNIRAKHLDQLLSIEGIVRQASDVKPQVVNARFECPSCGAILSVLQVDRKFHDPARCSCNWKGNFKLLSKEMVDVQRLVIEESPDSLEGGEQPRRIIVFLKEDLVDPKMEKHSTPGSRIKIFGVLKEVPVPLPTGISTRFDIALEANNTIPMEESFEELDISEEDIKEIKELAADPKVFKRLAASIAPSIYGFDKIKEAILLQIFGGVKKTKSDGGKSRGDIHLLLVGDPGTAKSVMLKFVSTIAPKGRYVSGKAASAAGLCVAPNSVVLTNSGGMQTIQDVVENRLDENTEFLPGACRRENIGDIKIQSLSHDLKIHSKNPDFIWKLDVPEKVFEITLSSGKKIELTPNTQLYSIISGITEWKKSAELKEGDYIATPRKLIGGEKDNAYIVEVIESNPVIHSIKPFVRKVVEKLKEKYGSIMESAKILNVRENQLYFHWVNERARGNIKLNDLRKIAEAADIDWKNEVKWMSIYNGKKHKIPLFLDKEVLYLAGLIAGDGDLQRIPSNSYSVRLSNSCKELQVIFRDILVNKFGLKYNVAKGNEKRPEATRTFSRILGEILLSLGILTSPKSHRIFLSNTLLHLSNELMAEYIAGLYDTDGSVYVRKSEGSNCVELTTCSETLARQMQLVLLRFGIHAAMRNRPPSEGKIKGNYSKWILEIHSLDEIRKFAKCIPLRHPEKKKKLNELIENSGNYIIFCPEFSKGQFGEGSDAINRIVHTLKNVKSHSNIDLIPGVGELVKELLKDEELPIRKAGWHKNFSRTGLQKILLKIKSNNDKEKYLRQLAYGDVFWEKVVKIEEKVPIYKYVYDLTIKDSHNFVVNGVLVHNTAAVVKDEFLRGWSLEAGAMVLSNKGTVAIDEIEKMNEQDRSTLHEAMEQQSVTISKANIQATLRAETTVLAAGNPKMGRFDPYTPIPQQIDISPALLTRFDVIFIIRDLPNKVQDEAIASHVLEEHQQQVIRDVVEPKLLRKYIAYAKQKIKPKLTDEAAEEIKDFYIKLRNQSIKTDSDIKPIPITARQLEGIVRLSEAHAKIHLRDKVGVEDARNAIDLLKISLSQVGYDEETQSFDIDRITTGISSSKRGKILVVKDAISQLESRLGKLLPLEELEKFLENKISKIELEEAIEQLSKMGDIFKPKKGFIQKI